MHTEKIKDKSNDIRIGYIGGGSMNWAWELMGDLALDGQLSGEVRLYDVDHEAAAANATIGNSISARPDIPGKWRYIASPILPEALTGVDFVVISILPGTFDEMESDVHAPEAYGVFQSVGDTAGPGGIVRAMRTLPMFVEIAEAIKAYCPFAWVINYTNPMSVCTGMLYHVFPEIKAFGCCHEVFHAQELLAAMLRTEHNVAQVTRGDIQLNVMGVNHFTWIDQAAYRSTDLMPLFAAFADKYAETGYALGEGDKDTGNPFRNLNKVCFDLFRRYGVIPAAGDRHVAEFMPPWYLKDPETSERWGFTLTPVSWRKANRARLVQKRARILSGAEAFEPHKSGEEGTEQIKALLGLREMVTNVNLPNIGQMEGFVPGAVVETNAVFSRDVVRPVFAGKLPEAVNLLETRHAMNQQCLIRACADKDINLAFNVFLNDNLMTLDIADAEKLFTQMLANTRAYLPGWPVK